MAIDSESPAWSKGYSLRRIYKSIIKGTKIIPKTIVKATKALANFWSRSCSTEKATASAAAGETAEIKIIFCPMPVIPNKEVNIKANNTETPITMPAERNSLLKFSFDKKYLKSKRIPIDTNNNGLINPDRVVLN